MEGTFSDRYGYNQIPEEHFIYEDAPEKLRVYIKKIVYDDMDRSPSFLRSIICRTILVRENPQNWSEYPNIDWEVDEMLFEMEWYQVYDVVESLAKEFDRDDQYEQLMNDGFKRLGIGWQLKDGVIQTRGDEAFEHNLRTAQTALEESGFAIAHRELKEAIEDLSKRPKPDLTGCVQHATGALESVAREITGLPNKTLGDILRTKPDILPKPLDDSMSKMWGYACEFARHIREDRDIARREALLILGISSTIITYLIEIFRR